ncbi:uncharacterized protein TNCV_1021581 [Trichonephila clavipes]|uniref:Uncharacterized protein n=1 Tax=Trichonephila clavipes TaxID=2585209 RepID=A0A8X6VN28_TRICX|nr:uncharacterized protein TNCV_1021581 [Trichonephila clavipes]
MPPNTLRVHTEYVFFKSVDPKVLWVVAAETPMAGDWRIFRSHSVPCLNCGGGDRWCHHLSLRPKTDVHLAPWHDEFRGPRSDYIRQGALETTTIGVQKCYALRSKWPCYWTSLNPFPGELFLTSKLQCGSNPLAL